MLEEKEVCTDIYVYKQNPINIWNYECIVHHFYTFHYNITVIDFVHFNQNLLWSGSRDTIAFISKFDFIARKRFPHCWPLWGESTDGFVSQTKGH